VIGSDHWRYPSRLPRQPSVFARCRRRLREAWTPRAARGVHGCTTVPSGSSRDA